MCSSAYSRLGPDAVISSRPASTSSICTSISSCPERRHYSTLSHARCCFGLTFSGFLESLCDKLYDHLRPRILHEPSLEVLCGVCTVLQALMVQDVNIDEDPDEAIYYSPNSTPGSPAGNGPEDYFSLADETFSARQRRTGSVRGYSGSVYGRRDAPKRHRKPLDRLHTEVLLRMVLQDAQTRLVFRAQALLRADVEYYVPKDGDLDYPDKIKGQIIHERTE